MPVLLALGLVTAPNATAETITGGALTNDTPVTATITKTDQVIEYSLAATNGGHQTLDITASAWAGGSADLAVVDPEGTAQLYCGIATGPSYCDFTPDSTGTWKIKVLPGSTTGSVTFKALADQNKGTLVPGTPATATIGTRGQRAVFSFAAVAGKPTVIDVPASSWGAGGGASLWLYQPNGELAMRCDIDAPTECELTPRAGAGGTWKAAVVPSEGSLGSATLAIGTDPNQGTLGATPVTVAISARATTASYTFNATAGVRHVIDVTASDWGNGTAKLTIYDPKGVGAVVCDLEKAALTCPWTPPVSGLWSVEIAPVANAVGSAKIAMAADLTKGVLAGGVETPVKIETHGQRVFYTFPATKGEKKVINVLNSNWGAGEAELIIYEPAGKAGVVCKLNTARVSCPFSPRDTGTWKVGIEPKDDAIGSATLVLVADSGKGVMTAGTPVTTTLSTKGTTASYTFTATKEVRTTIDVTATDWGTGTARLNIYLPNGDLGLWCDIKKTATLCPMIPRDTGTWKVVIDPLEDAVGSVTMVLGADVNKGTLAQNTSTQTVINSRGWSASYNFSATAKVHTTLDVTASDWGTSKASLLVFRPNSTVLVAYCPLAGVPTVCDFIPPVTGSYKVTVEPAANATGKVTMTLAAAQDKGALTVGTPASATIAVKGQRAFWTFDATAGTTTREVSVTATNWGTGGAHLAFYTPAGDRVLACPITSVAKTCSFLPKLTGTWKLQLEPVDNALGSATFTLK